jgi:peptidoglycan/LPS O-acetylase OafA/YrhL
MGTKLSNNFGFLRLFFASLVILSHSFDLVDGDGAREYLYRIFGTITLSSIALTGFFLISGYLITASLVNSSSLKSYMLKRVLRIYPGFIVASIVSIFIFAPLSGGWILIQQFSFTDWLKIPIKFLILTQPWVEGAFSTVKNPVLNASMWTIKYEFLCYLSIMILALVSYKRHVMVVVLITALTMYLYTVFANHDLVTAKPFDLSLHFFGKFLSAFAMGSVYYLYRDSITWNKLTACLAFALLVLCLLNDKIAELGLIVIGSYLLFYFSLHYKNDLLSKVGSKNDISYGVYLYAFPFQNLMVQCNPSISPHVLSGYTLVYAFIIGYISWILVEKPFIEMKRKLN